MSLKIILGPKSAKKSECIYTKIQQDIKEKNNVLLFVPSQKRVVCENEYMDVLNLDGIIDLKITTISEYIKEILKLTNIHINEKYLTSLDKNILITKLLKENMSLFKKYKKVVKKDGFISEIANYIDILRNNNINEINELENIKNLKINNKSIKEKISEILKIYEKYLENLNKMNFLDDTSYINIYSKKELEFPEKVYCDGYNNFKKIELDVIEMYIKKGSDVTISLVTDAKNIFDVHNQKTSEIFEVSNNTYLELIKLSQKYNIDVEEEYIEYFENKPEDLKMLATNTFSYENVQIKQNADNIKIYLVNNEKSEILDVANKIICACENGKKFYENIIYTSDISKYENAIKQVFYEYNIPFYIDEAVEYSGNILIKYILNLFEIIKSGHKSKQIIKILKLNLNTKDITLDQVQKIENYCLEFNIYDFNKKFIYNSKINHDLDELNQIRVKILKIFEFQEVNKTENLVNHYIHMLYEHLEQNGIVDAFVNLINNEEYIDLININSQILSKLNDISDSIYKIYKDEMISFEEFVEIFNMAVKQTVLKTIPEKTNQVLILDINRSKTTSKENVYVLGANEGEFPIEAREDAIFNDIELEEIENSGFIFKESTMSKYNMGLYNIYEVFNLPLNNIFIYIKSSNMSGNALNKSKVIEQIQDVFNIDIIGKVLQEEELNVYTSHNLLKLMLETKDEKQKVAIYNYLCENKQFNLVLNWKKNDENLNKDTLQLLYNDKITSSITKLESFKKCPFSYYLKYIIEIRKREEYEISNLDLGSFMHSVIEKFSNYILSKNIMWHQLFIEEEYQKIEFKIEEIIEAQLDEILFKQKENIRFQILRQKLIVTIKSIIKIIAKSFNQSEFTPFGYEVEFKNGSIFAPIILELENGKKIELIGKIDRIDTMTLNNKMYVRVVDYKSSKRELKLDDIKNGISLQLLTYLATFIENMKNKNIIALPAAMTYFTISDKMLSLDEALTEDEIKSEIIKKLRLNGIFLKDIDVLNKMDKKFETQERLIDVSKISFSKNSEKLLDELQYGELLKEAKDILKKISSELISGVVKISPTKDCDSCKYCEYSSICRKNIKL